MHTSCALGLGRSIFALLTLNIVYKILVWTCNNWLTGHLAHAVAFKYYVHEINEELAQQTVLLFNESSMLP